MQQYRFFVDENLKSYFLLYFLQEVIKSDAITVKSLYRNFLYHWYRKFTDGNKKYYNLNKLSRKTRRLQNRPKYNKWYYFPKYLDRSMYSSMDDLNILHESILEDRIILTRDKDFFYLHLENLYLTGELLDDAPPIIRFKESITNKRNNDNSDSAVSATGIVIGNGAKEDSYHYEKNSVSIVLAGLLGWKEKENVSKNENIIAQKIFERGSLTEISYRKNTYSISTHKPILTENKLTHNQKRIRNAVNTFLVKEKKESPIPQRIEKTLLRIGFNRINADRLLQYAKEYLKDNKNISS